MMRLVRVLVLVVAMLGLALPLASPASAALGIDDCKDSPPPVSPDSGIGGFFTDTPDEIPADPKGGAWVDGAPVYANYGVAAYRFHTYDLGCGADVTRDPMALISTGFSNWVLIVPKFMLSGTDALLGAAYFPTYLQTFNPLLIDATAALKGALFDAWIPLSVAVVGLMLLAYARKGAAAKAASAVLWALLVMGIATVVAQWPVQAGTAADGAVATVLGEVNDRINNTEGTTNPVDATMGTVSNAALFEEWKIGTFGSADSATAEKYAQPIFTAQSFTWAEAAAYSADPEGAGADLIEDKATLWEDTANEIQEVDPAAYLVLQGKDSEARVSAAFISLFAALITTPFLIVSALILIGSYLVIRFAVVFTPAIATIAVIYPLRSALIGVGLVVAAALSNSLFFGVGTAIDLLGVRLLLGSSALPLWLAMMLCLVLTFVMWAALKPARALTTMASPKKMFSDGAGAAGAAAAGAKDFTVAAGKAAAAGYVGGAVAAKKIGDDTEEPRAEEFTNDPVHVDTVRTDQPTPTPTSRVDAAPVESEQGALPPGTIPIVVPPMPAPDVTTAPTEDDTFVPGNASAPEQRLPTVAETTIDDDGDDVYFIPFTADDDEEARQ